MNYDPWSYVISVGQGYLVNHIVSTKFEIVIARLSFYFFISNHPVMVSIILMDLRFNFVLSFLFV